MPFILVPKMRYVPPCWSVVGTPVSVGANAEARLPGVKTLMYCHAEMIRTLPSGMSLSLYSWAPIDGELKM